MSKNEINDNVEQYAYHEAGHAILALASHVSIPRLSILSQDYSCEVEVEVDFLRGASMDIELGLLRYFCFLIAGKEAERKYLAIQNSEIDEASLAKTAGVDYSLIEEKMSFLQTSENPMKIDIENLLLQVNEFLNTPTVWNSVQDLASKLLNYKELNELEPDDFPIPSFTPTLELTVGR